MQIARMATFVPFDRTQPFLFPPEMRDWLPADDFAHFIVAAVERVPLAAFAVSGARNFPRMSG